MFIHVGVADFKHSHYYFHSEWNEYEENLQLCNEFRDPRTVQLLKATRSCVLTLPLRMEQIVIHHNSSKTGPPEGK